MVCLPLQQATEESIRGGDGIGIAYLFAPFARAAHNTFKVADAIAKGLLRYPAEGPCTLGPESHTEDFQRPRRAKSDRRCHLPDVQARALSRERQAQVNDPLRTSIRQNDVGFGLGSVLVKGPVTIDERAQFRSGFVLLVSHLPIMSLKEQKTAGSRILG